ANEPVHTAAGALAQIPAGHVRHRAASGVRAAEIAVPEVVKGPHAAAAPPTWNTRHPTVVPSHAGDPVRSREGAEIVVKGTVLLHDDHYMADLVDPAEPR